VIDLDHQSATVVQRLYLRLSRRGLQSNCKHQYGEERDQSYALHRIPISVEDAFGPEPLTGVRRMQRL
jgi:hypothetical protein